MARHRWRLRNADLSQEIEVRGNLQVNNVEMLRQAALGDLDLALLPVLDGHQANLGEMGVGLYAVYSASKRRSAKIKAFTDTLIEALR